MKSFKHLKKLDNMKVTRKALRHYALYRAIGKSLDVSLQALIDFHKFESLGILPKGFTNFTQFSKTNGYAYGKWILKITQDTIIQDIASGDMVKAEFMNSHHHADCFNSSFSSFRYERFNWFWFNCLKNITVMNKPFWHI